MSLITSSPCCLCLCHVHNCELFGAFFSSVNLTFVMSDGEKVETAAKVGDNLLDVVIENDVDIDGFG